MYGMRIRHKLEKHVNGIWANANGNVNAASGLVTLSINPNAIELTKTLTYRMIPLPISANANAIELTKDFDIPRGLSTDKCKSKCHRVKPRTLTYRMVPLPISVNANAVELTKDFDIPHGPSNDKCKCHKIDLAK